MTIFPARFLSFFHRWGQPVSTGAASEGHVNLTIAGGQPVLRKVYREENQFYTVHCRA